MGEKMDYLPNGMRMERNILKGLIRMRYLMDYGLDGMKMDRRKKKEFIRMEKQFLKNVGMKMGMKKSVIK